MMDAAEDARIEAHIAAQTCSVCHRHLDYAQGYYSTLHAHAECAHRNGRPSLRQAYAEASARINHDFAEMGLGHRRRSAPLGSGGPTRALREIIRDSARDQFATEDVDDVQIWLPAPVWRQHRFDVMRVEGSVRIDGHTRPFGSWASVTELTRYRRVTFLSDPPGYEIVPDHATRRSRLGSRLTKTSGDDRHESR